MRPKGGLPLIREVPQSQGVYVATGRSFCGILNALATVEAFSDHDALAKLKADNDNLRATKDNEAAQIKVLTQRVDALESAHR
jgi:hypothetical protein